MAIPLRNVYWLLCYAWDVLEEADIVDVGSLDAVTTQDLLAAVLSSGVRHVVRRGLDRDYIPTQEDTSSLRGRIEVSQTMTRLLEQRAQAHVQFDELSPDVPANQVLKATALAMIKTEQLSRNNRDVLASLYSSLRGVSDQRLSYSLLRRVRLHRNNRSYRLLMELCRLVHENLIPDEIGGNYLFRDFLQDEKQMRFLFQKFVFNFLSREQNSFEVRSNSVPWHDVLLVMPGPGEMPMLTTDMTLTNTQEVLIIDTKFTLKSLESYMGGKKKLRTEHLYQIWAYVSNFVSREVGSRSIRGLLLYPSEDDSFRTEWTIRGHFLGIAGINFQQDFAQIRFDLLALLRHPPLQPTPEVTL